MSTAYLALQLAVCVAAIATWMVSKLVPRLGARSIGRLTDRVIRSWSRGIRRQSLSWRPTRKPSLRRRTA